MASHFENALEYFTDAARVMDISRSIKSSAKFLDMVGSLFRKLSQLDYIGKEKETPKPPEPKPSIFINEEEETRKKKGLWNF